MRKLVLLLTCLFICTLPANAKDLHKFVDVDGAARSYDLHVPRSYKGAPTALVIVLHGALGCAATAKADTDMVRHADKHGFISVYPDGTPMFSKRFRTWNAGACCGVAADQNIDDVSFINSIIAQVESDYNIDAERVYVCGLSNGGMLAYKIAAELSDKIAAAASIEGAMVSPEPPAKGPVSIIAFHSTHDAVLPYNGGTGNFFGHEVSCLPVSVPISYWVRADGCCTVPKETHEDGLVKQTYTGGAAGTEVCLYTSKYGHAWPFLRTLFSPISGKRAPSDIVCRFFENHPKQAQ